MFESYNKDKINRQEQGLPPLPLNAEQTQELIKLFEKEEAQQEHLDLLENEVSPGVDESAYVKAGYLKELALEQYSNLISPSHAIKLLGTMLGGYSVEALVSILKANTKKRQPK